ncbi:GrpB family protein [Viridibacillus sp. NPDC096237]|uniref:GrpB family protein n=1 Tax=Viridibacillus sp. NPDC096237 TaxID=3390721 RepID=UPI003D0792C7
MFSNLHLAFRDYLRSHPAEASKYGLLKQQNALLHPFNIDAYIKEKSTIASEIFPKSKRSVSKISNFPRMKV